MDDFGFDSGGYSLWGDTPDLGSSWDMGDWNLGGQTNAPSWSEPFSLGGPGYNSGFDTSWLNAYTQPQPQMGTQGPLGIPQGGPSLQQQPPAQPSAPGAPGAANAGASPWLAAGLGALGPIAGLVGTLASGGQGPTSGVKPNTAQQANMNRGNLMLEQGAMGSLPAQQMQMSLLQALASGQGLPAGYQQLIEQSFQPQMGSLYEQAVRAGRSRGFHDAPAQSPAGGAILGRGLSDLQGQMAAAKIGMMHSLPQLFNQPAATQGQLAQAYGGQVSDPRLMQQTQTAPMGPQIANAVGNVFSGGAQGYNAAQAQKQQQDMNQSILQALQGNQRITMSGQG